MSREERGSKGRGKSARLTIKLFVRNMSVHIFHSYKTSRRNSNADSTTVSDII